MTDRGLERADAVLTYDGQSRAAGERVKTIEAALAAAKVLPRALSGLPGRRMPSSAASRSRPPVEPLRIEL